MKLLAIDYGVKRIGLALSDTTDKVVVLFGVIENKGIFFVLEELKKIFDEESVEKIIIGMPYHNKFKEVKKMIEKFIEFLRKNVDIEIDIADERFTSKVAMQDERYKDLYKDKTKGWKDARAAEEILRGYIEKL